MQYNKILAVIEADSSQQKSLSRALEIARMNQASITAFLCIYDFSYEMTTMLSMDERENMRQAVVDDRTDWLKNLVAKTIGREFIDINVKIVWHNRPYESIIREVLENGYDLIVKGTQHHDTLESVIFTPTDWHIMRKAPVPVLLVKEHDWPIGGKIIAAINAGANDADHLSLNEQVTKHANSFGSLLASDVHLVNAYPSTPLNIVMTIPDFDPVTHQETVKEHHKLSLQTHGKEYQISTEFCHVAMGLPEDVIPGYASKLDAELVVLGTVGRQGISAALIGNTAEHVIDKLNCDVLAIKPDGFISPIKLS
ncbi:universal stress protein UspE [uncultured Paraglaciecola sp.]|uniref:universal stress protein UspE n=1 Tax=uncultured Paraglaciecola sp. TaxID=1765024 RepID=UPI002594FD62|nr:universal stress protein UspE [uncultured Paraglaciecola sp.]